MASVGSGSLERGAELPAGERSDPTRRGEERLGASSGAPDHVGGHLQSSMPARQEQRQHQGRRQVRDEQMICELA
eukprot:gene13362-51526_t